MYTPVFQCVRVIDFITNDKCTLQAPLNVSSESQSCGINFYVTASYLGVYVVHHGHHNTGKDKEGCLKLSTKFSSMSKESLQWHMICYLN